MCYLCDEYGDSEFGGGLWYLNPKNHARNMYTLRLPGVGFRGADAGVETGARSGPTTADLLEALEKGQLEECESIKQQMAENTKQRGMQSQVVPLEDADKVLELCSPMGLIACICRKGVRGVDDNAVSVAYCRNKGLLVERAGIMEFLRNQPDRSCAVVSAFHVVEHLTFPTLLSALTECARVLISGDRTPRQ